MRIHILGICGTFMGGLAQILKESGHSISGSDNQFYPPMSVHLEGLDVEMIKGYSSKSMPDADLYIIGNALSRGNECVEYILDNQLPFRSGPEMLGEILKNRKVLAISGTHGKTTTSYMLAHIFLNQGRDIGFLVGGVSEDIKGSASLGTDNIFVIEADEYDSAFFDKRSKFIHYSPSTLVINNIEFDHADIFDHLDDIKRQFHHLIKIIPSSGEVIYFSDDKNSEDVISKGLWCKSSAINNNEIKISFEEQELEYRGIAYSLAGLPLIGLHNFKNYIAAILAAKTDDIAINDSIESLTSFNGVKRRLEYKGKFSNIHLYDDFAHHPTAIKFSSQAIRTKYPAKKILGLIELGSNTMSGGSHGIELLDTVACLDKTVWLDHKNVLSDGNDIISSDNIEDFINQTKSILSEYDVILLMTNKDSHKILKPLINHLEKK
ncbi:UDP-N-acetylmuramate:L-alanyl-gamma-D-glutamyl-meso-diaminopimelate ligase [Gammaproteobacteria bacterium]|jgi:UDP-N-acetylmuramate: L-alanyl-gamma-D-glutamyl-meso-diaminopimelate ligase|nr:UDP-N-acetylmuramate:L-alanyl-gamma-D-glutamyl-meso-diaminopimelate ligase [Gammaproteobacteria bacterium]MDA7845217.1 UDP-N-acetylmuramate:L-alanyl-gamma-D-glutamyl-meso-diaminopimelate ligase [Gammaproteobacteria bacterium]MDA9039620.1 UDP-N-acetylmuramate:L-alanyl-gamma-D-glutamyl-meso-diaminopimelate ligase [Gammaproteobacteria bacterium]MDA9102156.1 UDP-N-acetylmuramate:L-alanyl-gamma-D-glutamyl-meso-diaminopimelate ligase [Gammaproteobacteria bacterium]